MRNLTEAQLPLALRAEKTVARIRVTGGLVGAAITLSEMSTHPSVMLAIETCLYLAAIVVGLVTSRLLPRMDVASMPRLSWTTFAADIVIIGATDPSNAGVTGVLSSPAGILLPVIGGMKFGIRGARLGTTAFAVLQIVYELLRTQVFGIPGSIVSSVAVVVIGAVLGAMAGRVSHDARLALTRAEERTAALAFESGVALAQRYHELDRLKTEFIAVASHELRTPLTAVNGHAETLDRLWRELDEDVTDQLIGGIRDHGRRLADLVDDLTTVGALGQGEIELAVESVIVEDLVAEAIADCGTPADVLLERRAQTCVLADPERLRTCLGHLIMNAVQHGRPPVRISVHTHGPQVAIVVRDQGDGIPLDRRHHLFEPFVVARDVLAHHHGSGLGLALVRRQVTAMGGTVELVDSETRGATFRIELPAAGLEGGDGSGRTRPLAATAS